MIFTVSFCAFIFLNVYFLFTCCWCSGLSSSVCQLWAYNIYRESFFYYILFINWDYLPSFEIRMTLTVNFSAGATSASSALSRLLSFISSLSYALFNTAVIWVIFSTIYFVLVLSRSLFHVICKWSVIFVPFLRIAIVLARLRS